MERDMVPKTPPKMQRRALVALNPNQVRETLKKVDHCMARLQELQCIVTGRSEVIFGVNLSPRSTITYSRTSLRCKQETLRMKGTPVKKSPMGKFQGAATAAEQPLVSSQHQIIPPKLAPRTEFQIIHTLMSHFVTPFLNESEAEEVDSQVHNAVQQQIDNLIAHQQVADPADQLSAGTNAALAAHTEPGISRLNTISTTAHLPLRRSMHTAAKKASSPRYSIYIAATKKCQCRFNSKKPKKRKQSS